MVKTLKKILKKFFSPSCLQKYHVAKSFIAALVNGFPSRKLLVIGITGTKGKSTTANFLWAALQASGKKCGLMGTANFRIGTEEFPNVYHMTMPSPFVIQSWMKKMVKSGCQAIVMEVTSEGINQFRNLNILFDAGVFTNLSPEHLPSHNNSFEEYRNTKRKFFEQLSLQTKKKAVAFVNADAEFADFFSSINGLKTILTSILGKGNVQGIIQKISKEETIFEVENFPFSIAIGGNKNVENALLAVAVAHFFGGSFADIQKGFFDLKIIPGRLEKIEEGQNFSVVVDYAHEEKSMRFLMETAENWKKNAGGTGRIIVLLGAEGGGRDKSKRPKMGKIVGQKADIVVVSNVDPYEDDPTPICEDIAIAAEQEGKKRGENLFVIEDRRTGFAKCFSLAKEGDFVFLTGKGSEQSMIIEGNEIPWDDRTIAREELQKNFSKK